MNKSEVIQLAKPWQKKEALPDKIKDSALIDRQVEEFLANGGEIQQIPSNLHRSAEEIGMIAASQRNSLNKEQQKVHNKRKAKHQSDSARHQHLSKRESLSEVVR